MTANNIYGKFLKDYRKKNGLTQKQVATELGVTNVYIYRIERGEAVSLERVKAITSIINKLSLKNDSLDKQAEEILNSESN